MESLSPQNNRSVNTSNVSKVSDPVGKHDPGLVVQEPFVGALDVFYLERQKTKAICFGIVKVKKENVINCGEGKRAAPGIRKTKKKVVHNKINQE